eukprot:g11144.t1
MSAQPGGSRISIEDYVFVDAPDGGGGLVNDVAAPASAHTTGEEALQQASLSFVPQRQLAAGVEPGPPGTTADKTGEKDPPPGEDSSGQALAAAQKRSKKEEAPAPPLPCSPLLRVAPAGGGDNEGDDDGDDDGDEASTAASPADRAGSDNDDERSEAMSGDWGSNDGQESDYDSDYEMEDDSDSDGEVIDSTMGKDLAKADTAVFDEDADGMFARVETPSMNLLRIWVCVHPWRLFEGMAHTTAVEALGLDPNRGVLVMMTTNQHYLASGERPKVKWARQVDMDKIDKDDMPVDGSVGEIFPLQGTLCQRLQEELARFCSGAADRKAARPPNSAPPARQPSSPVGAASGGRDLSERGSGGSIDVHGEPSRDGGGAAASATGADAATAEKMAGGGSAERDSSAIRFAIVTIRESTGVTAELAAYALLVSKYDEQLAQLKLVDDELRPSLEDGLEKFSRLKGLVPTASDANILNAMVVHPTCLQRQQSFLRGVGTGDPPQPPTSSWDLRRIELERLAETNPLVLVALTIANKLRNANKRCLVCDDKIEGFLPAVPIVCPKEFCRWRSEQMGSGTDVESQVAKKGDTVNLLIDLFWMAMNGSRWELAFPDTVQCGPELVFKRADGRNNVDKVRQVLDVLPSVADMQRCIERKRNNLAGGITSPPPDHAAAEHPWSAAAAANAAANAAAANAAAEAAAAAAAAAATEKENALAAATAATAAATATPASAASGSSATSADADGGRGTRTTSAEEWVARATAACTVATAHAANAAAAAAAASARAVAAGDPVAAAYPHAAAGAALGRGDPSRVLSLESALSERNPLTYRLLRWLLSANRAHLRPLRGPELIKEIPCDKQFMLVTGTAEREMRFQNMKQEVAAANGGKGSFFAFHGSGPGNWHGILQLGLKNMSGSKWMSSGQALGKGIYMADQLSVSFGYAGARGGGGCHWPHSATSSGGTPVIVAVCEVINREEYQKNDHRGHRHGYYVVPDEEAVATRFLLINPSISSRGITATGKTVVVSPGVAGETPLQEALDSVYPGDTIELVEGDYWEDLQTKVDGTSDNRITIRGSGEKEKIQIRGGGVQNRVFQVMHDFYTITGFTINGYTGKGSIDDVDDIGDQDMRDIARDKLIYATDHVTNAGIYDNYISDCGIYDFRFADGGKNGEGVYIGTSSSQWGDGKNWSDGPDVCMNNIVRNNEIHTRGNEGIDVKEGSTGTIVENNGVHLQRDPDSGGIGSRGDYSVIRFNNITNADGAGVRLGGHLVNGVQYGVHNTVIGNHMFNCFAYGVKTMVSPQGEMCGNDIQIPEDVDNVSLGEFMYRVSGGTYGGDYTPTAPCEPTECNPDEDDPCPDDQLCCREELICKDPDEFEADACGDPHMTGFHGQKFDFTGEDGGWYCLLRDLPGMHLNMRVTSPVPELPEITYITGLSVLTADSEGTEHSIVVTVKDPHNLKSSCPVAEDGSVPPCLADNALSVVLDGEEGALLAPGTAILGPGVNIDVVNLPGACRSFGFEKYWEKKKLENLQSGRKLLESISMAEWILGDPTATNMEECTEYVERVDADGSGVALFDYQSEHASFRITTPTATIRLSHGRLHQVAMRDPTDQYDLPDHLTWQMNVAVDQKDLSLEATGVLGETIVPRRDAAGNRIMRGMQAIRGEQEDYRVEGPLGVFFAQGKAHR